MPFGEYVPFADVIPELRLSFPMETTYTPGRDAIPLVSGSARIGPLLCYEDMVPSAAASLAADSANLLVSLIHGASFTNPLTLRQHRLLAQQRAIECRRCLARCGSTGETCLIDAAGRIVGRLPLGGEGMLGVEAPLLEPLPPGVRWRWALPAACAVGLAGLLFGGRLRSLGGLRG
jgi:apolipoprotein N-acyltransferase